MFSARDSVRTRKERRPSHARKSTSKVVNFVNVIRLGLFRHFIFYRPDPKPHSSDDNEIAENEDDMDTWSAAVRYQTSLQTTRSSDFTSESTSKRPKIRPDAYFSDEESFGENE